MYLCSFINDHKLRWVIGLIFLVSTTSQINHYYRWLTLDAAQQLVDELTNNELAKEPPPGRGQDRRNSTPILTGDAFRFLAQPHICDETNRCRFDPAKMTPGA